MSALGHERTFAVQYVMFALHLKEDMCSALGEVRFWHKADISSSIRLIRPRVRSRC